MALRLTVANTVLGEAISWLEGDGEVSKIKNVKVKWKAIRSESENKNQHVKVEMKSES